MATEENVKTVTIPLDEYFELRQKAESNMFLMNELGRFQSEMEYEEFLQVLEEHTGIVARPYTAYQFYDAAGNFLDNSDETCLEDLLEKARIEVIEDGV